MKASGGRNLTYGLQETLGRAIVGGRIKRGVIPTEADLAREYGVSRSVTREAVKMLAAKGLVSARPRVGTSVEPIDNWNLLDPDVMRWLLERKFSLQLLRQFTQLRMAIEPMAASLAAQARNPEKLEAIRAGLQRMEDAEAGRDDTLESDVEFHNAVLRGGDNPFFFQFEQLIDTALHTSIRFTNRFKGRSASLPAHRAVLESIEAGDAPAAHARMEAIISEVLDLIDSAAAKGEPDLVEEPLEN